MHIDTYTYNLLLWNIPTNLQARYDLFCVKSAIKPQPTNRLAFGRRVTLLHTHNHFVLIIQVNLC